jgi:hypothetical protein
MNFRRQTQEIVGDTYRYALFFNFPGGLRFELSEGGSPLDQALTALRKATVVCDDVFAGEERILVHLATYARPSRFALRTMLRELQVAGILVPKVRDVWVDAEEQTGAGDDGDEALVSCAFEAPVTKMQNLLWCAITTDSGPLRPKPRCLVYLLNPSTGVVVHPYDDRGMDVISRSTSALAGLYKKHSDLLLECNIDAMRETFGQI